MTPKLEDKPFFTAEEIAETLQTTRVTIHRLMNSGEIPYYQFGKMKRIRKEDFDAFLAKSRRGGRDETP